MCLLVHEIYHEYAKYMILLQRRSLTNDMFQNKTTECSSSIYR